MAGGTLIYLSPKERHAVKVAGQTLERVRGSGSAAPFRAKLGPAGAERLAFASEGLREIRTKVARIGRLERAVTK